MRYEYQFQNATLQGLKASESGRSGFAARRSSSANSWRPGRAHSSQASPKKGSEDHMRTAFCSRAFSMLGLHDVS